MRTFGFRGFKSFWHLKIIDFLFGQHDIAQTTQQGRDKASTRTMATIEEWYRSMPVITRTYMTLCFLTTLAVHLDFVSPLALYLNFHAIWYNYQASDESRHYTIHKS